MELHLYVRCHLKELRKVKGVLYGELITHADGTQGRVITAGRPSGLPDNFEIYFSHIMSFERHGSIWVLVTFYVDGEVSWPDMWAGRLLQVRNCEASR
jgi:hypothetical protein